MTKGIPVMKRFLILEDTPSTREQLVRLLQDVFPLDYFQEAIDTEDCRKRIADMEKNGFAFDVVILDAKVPGSPGENPEVDPNLPREIGEKMPNSLIIHCTAYAQDRAVEQRLNQQMRHFGEGQHVLVEKTGNYPEVLLRLIVRHLYESRIRGRLNMLFGQPPGTQLRVDGPPGGGYAGIHVTQELAALQRDICRWWEYLSEPTRAWIKACVFVDKTNAGVVASLFEPERPMVDSRKKGESTTASLTEPNQ